MSKEGGHFRNIRTTIPAHFWGREITVESMVVQGNFALPFHCVRSPGKRGYDVFQEDAIGCAKRARGHVAFATEERENMSPLHFSMGANQAQAVAQQMQNRGGQPAFQNHQAACMLGGQGMGAAQLGGSGGMRGAAQSEGMEIESAMDTPPSVGSSDERYQRFPSGNTSPTYYHASVSAVARAVDPQVDPLPMARGLCAHKEVPVFVEQPPPARGVTLHAAPSSASVIRRSASSSDAPEVIVWRSMRGKRLSSSGTRRWRGGAAGARS